MFDTKTVHLVGTIDDQLAPTYDQDYRDHGFRWLTLIGICTGRSWHTEGTGHSVKTWLELLLAGYRVEAEAFILREGGAMLIIGVDPPSAQNRNFEK